MTDKDRTSRERLYWLISLFKGGQLSTDAFCREFERSYNFELNKADLSPQEGSAFAALFDKVVWFSPFPEERARIPNYLGEEEIQAAADDAILALSHRNQ